MERAGQPRGVIIVAAGTGDRFGDPRKVLREVGGMPLLLHSVRAFRSVASVKHTVVVMGVHTFDAGARALDAVAGDGDLTLVVGGATRSASVRAGLDAMPEHIDLIAIHDAARPLVSRQLIEAVFTAAERTGAAVPVLPVTDTLVSVGASDGVYSGTVDRRQVRAAQTPQAAKRDWVTSALSANPNETDEGSALARAGYPVELVPGDPCNVKVTWPDDILVVGALLGRTCGT